MGSCIPWLPREVSAAAVVVEVEAAAAAVVERFWAPMMSGAPPRDAKTALQEWVQARGLPLPVYRTAAREGPDHLPVFTVQAMIEGFPAVESRAGTKRAAERAANSPARISPVRP